MKSNIGSNSKRRLEQDPDDYSDLSKRPRLGESMSQKLRKTRLTKELVQSAVQHEKDALAGQNTYVYPSLKEGHGQDIRVLIIERGENEPVRCKLVPSALQNSTSTITLSYPYVALSYYWGDGDPIHPVTISNYNTPTERMRQPSKEEEMFARKLPKNRGRADQEDWRGSGVILVRTTLYQALERFRKKDEDVYMWIDALCIDQDDVHERTAQVKRMHEVYLQAEKVSVWLGDGNEIEATPKECFGFLTDVLDIPNLKPMLEDLADRNNLDLRRNARHVVKLMCCNWFSRRWVIQELALAQKAVVVYGTEEMSWSDFADSIAIFIKSLEHIGPVLGEIIQKEARSVKDLQHIDAMHNIGANVLVSFMNNLFRRDENGDVQYRMMNLEGLVSSLLAFESKDPRDTIYAVLSLASDTYNLPHDTDEDENDSSPSSKLRPAYHRCLLDVYTDFTEYCIDQSESLDILLRHWAPAPDKNKQRDNCEPLPSWTPLLQKSPFGTAAQGNRGRSNGDGFVGASTRKGQRNYNATMDLNPSKEFRKTTSVPVFRRSLRVKYSGQMFVRGLKVGTVETITPRAAFGILFHEWFELSGFDHELWKSSRRWSKGRERIPESFWRTIVADRGPDGKNPPDWFYRACCECLDNLWDNGDLKPDEVIPLEQVSDITKSFLERVKAVVWDRIMVRVQLEGVKKTSFYWPCAKR